MSPPSSSSSSSSSSSTQPAAQQHIVHILEAVDDFLRNFLLRKGLSRTLCSFQDEWFAQRGAGHMASVPDALTHTQLLHQQLHDVRIHTHLLRQEVLVTVESLVKLQRERDFQRLQCKRVGEEKNRLMEDIKLLKKHLDFYEPALKHLDDKYHAARRHKRLDSVVTEPLYSLSHTNVCRRNHGRTERTRERTSKTLEEDPVRTSEVTFDLMQVKDPGSFTLTCPFRAHKRPISCISLHPREPILCSASDDLTWRLWALPAHREKVARMLLTGEGHTDWLSFCTFQSDGSKLATTSGDTMVRVWDVSDGRCMMTLSGHGQPTWSCSFHSDQHFLASCSSDRTVKLWNLSVERCQLTLRRHTAAVNSVCFLPSFDLLLSSSADKTLALWDTRLGVCSAVLRGHMHPCNYAAASPAGIIMASCDSRGVVNLWDMRKPSSVMATVDAGPLSANQVAFSPSGQTVAVACSDGLVRLVEVASCAVSSLSGHSDAVQSVTFGHEGETVMSAGSDGLIKVWSGSSTV